MLAQCIRSCLLVAISTHPHPHPQALRAAFTALMTADSDKVASAISGLVQRLNQQQAGGRQLSEKEALVLRLNQQYPNDVGVLSAFFLNLVSEV